MGFAICQEHWDMLRKAMEDRGLMHIVPKNGEDAMALVKADLEGKSAVPENFDPLMSCHWMIMNQALNIGGLSILMMPEKFCPICKVKEVNENPDAWKEWIDGPADAALEECQKRGLVAITPKNDATS